VSYRDVGSLKTEDEPDVAVIAIAVAAALLICALAGLIAVCVRRSKRKEAKHQDDAVDMEDVQVPVNPRGSVVIPSSADITDIDIKERLGGGNFSEVFKGK
jgi:hypothetical protein